MWSQRKLIINALVRRKQQPQDSKKQARRRSRSYKHQSDINEGKVAPKKEKSKSTQKAVSKKSVKNLRLNPRKAQIN